MALGIYEKDVGVLGHVYDKDTGRLDDILRLGVGVFDVERLIVFRVSDTFCLVLTRG